MEKIDFRQKAVECRRLAMLAHSAKRKSLLEIVDHWTALAVEREALTGQRNP